jgi:hypothetical protein
VLLKEITRVVKQTKDELKEIKLFVGATLLHTVRAES